ncbi:MBL fold metallo-hydrolase [Desulfatitalea tepidiphila]|uniref:MBL fold metallo-hydrolase n=1 Tax=Desulfatitalea tepidiphila TaxID=1185843 RepID=UPI0006B63532|nr:MBL fold metallo-hydrolase [Desulfatitalea tepidiphila]
MPKSSHVVQAADNLFMVTLPVAITGFADFITAWVWTAGPVVVVDVGPSSTNGRLLSALAELGVRHLDFILLTHIHIDHAGGIGGLARAFSGTPVVCHPKAVEHLVDPQRLWEGSVKTLGDVARAYGPIEPVPGGQVLPMDRFEAQGIVPIATPGHAPHHFSFLMGDLLFAGEAGGVCLSLENGEAYLRPATPPRFRIQTSLDSIDRLIARAPRRICYGHVGMRSQAVEMLDRQRAQLKLWLEKITPWYERHPQGGSDLMEACLEDLLASDPSLSRFNQLSPDVRSRERFFLLNSVRGYWGYLAEQ